MKSDYPPTLSEPEEVSYGDGYSTTCGENYPVRGCPPAH
jgi:hypothetical protein